VNVFPAIVTVPVRELVAVFALTEYPTVPLPDPLAPPVTVIQLLLLDAVQAHPESADTLTDPVAADALTDLDADEVVYVQVGVPPPMVKAFDGELVDDPPAPTAATRASYVPAGGQVVTTLDRLTVITLLPSGVGLPSA
jgi:hypothetical protein